MATITERLNSNTAGINEASELLKVLGDRNGKYVWKQLTAEGGDFVAFVTADDENSYPDGGTQDGYWYELVEEGGGITPEMFGFTKMAIDKIAVSSNTYPYNIDLPHSLGEVPIMVIIMTDGLREGGSNLYYAIATYYPNMITNYKYTTAYAYYSAGFVLGNYSDCNNGSSATTWNASKIRFSSSQLSAQLPAGVEYTIVTMA